MRYRGKVCVITGAGSGIGRATAERMAAEGGCAAVVDHATEHGEETVRAIVDAGGQALFVQADVADTADVCAALTLVVARWGRVDVLVNNAAIMTYTPIVELCEEEWDRVMSVNLRAVFLWCKYALPHMAAGGAIVNVSSVHAHETTPNVVPYAASKGGLEAFTRGLSRELGDRGPRVNSVVPGAVDTPLLRMNPNLTSGAERLDGAVGTPEDLAAVIAFVASDEARFVNGATVVADGGRLAAL